MSRENNAQSNAANQNAFWQAMVQPMIPVSGEAFLPEVGARRNAGLPPVVENLSPDPQSGPSVVGMK